MRSKYLLLSVFLSVLVSTVGGFAFDVYGTADEFGGMMFLAIVMAFIISGTNLAIHRKIQKDTGQNARLSYPLTLMAWVCAFVLVFGEKFEFLRAVAPIAVAIMAGVIIGSVFQLAIFWGVEHSGDPVRWIQEKSRKGKKEVKYITKEKEEEKKKEETILKIFHILKENPAVLQQLQGAMEASRDVENIDLITELKKLYKESKRILQDQEIIDKMEAGTELIEDALREEKSAGWQKTTTSGHRMHSIRTAVENTKKEKEKLLKEEEEDLHVVIEIIHLLGVIIERNAVKIHDEKVKDGEKEHYKKNEKVLKEVRKLFRELRDELKEGLSYAEKIKKFGRKVMRKKYKEAKKGEGDESDTEASEIEE